MPASRRKYWSGRPDLNRRPPAPKAGALPGCATPRHEVPCNSKLFPHLRLRQTRTRSNVMSRIQSRFKLRTESSVHNSRASRGFVHGNFGDARDISPTLRQSKPYFIRQHRSMRSDVTGSDSARFRNGWGPLLSCLSRFSCPGHVISRGLFLSKIRLRTKFLLSLLAISAGLTAATLVIVSYSVRKRVGENIREDVRNSVTNYQSFQAQQ